jgi:hypothetical protein
MVLASVLGLPAEDWSAIAACSAVVLALVAGVIALIQVLQARRLRKEQAQPYVVAYLAPSAAASWAIDLVIKNLGATAATDVRVVLDPAAVRAIDGETGDGLALPEVIPLLVPGQEWRSLWDTINKRHGSGLPDEYKTTVSFTDAHGRDPQKFKFVLDWDTVMRRDVVTTYGLHDAAEALRDINKIVKQWSEGAGKGLAVFARDGDARDQRTREYLDKRRQQREQKPPADT